jgi:small multidrug resistance family-3 protein
MTLQIKLLILVFLIAATTMEVSGDAIIRNGLAQASVGTKALYFLTGAALLFGYGLLLNLAPIEFNRVVGIYIATLFVVWQAVSFVAFRSVPGLPVLIGGSLIIAGGLVVAFWGEATPHA